MGEEPEEEDDKVFEFKEDSGQVHVDLEKFKDE